MPSSLIASKTQSHFCRFSAFFQASLSVILPLFRHLFVEIGGVVGADIVTSVSDCMPSSTPAIQHKLYMVAIDPGV